MRITACTVHTAVDESLRCKVNDKRYFFWFFLAKQEERYRWGFELKAFERKSSTNAEVDMAGRPRQHYGPVHRLKLEHGFSSGTSVAMQHCDSARV